MLVCVCKAIRHSDIQELMRKKEACDLEQVKQSCGAGTDCGSCEQKIERILNQSLDLQKQSAKVS